MREKKGERQREGKKELFCSRRSGPEANEANEANATQLSSLVLTAAESGAAMAPLLSSLSGQEAAFSVSQGL